MESRWTIVFSGTRRKIREKGRWISQRLKKLEKNVFKKPKLGRTHIDLSPGSGDGDAQSRSTLIVARVSNSRG